MNMRIRNNFAFGSRPNDQNVMPTGCFTSPNYQNVMPNDCFIGLNHCLTRTNDRNVLLNRHCFLFNKQYLHEVITTDDSIMIYLYRIIGIGAFIIISPLRTFHVNSLKTGLGESDGLNLYSFNPDFDNYAYIYSICSNLYHAFLLCDPILLKGGDAQYVAKSPTFTIYTVRRDFVTVRRESLTG